MVESCWVVGSILPPGKGREIMPSYIPVRHAPVSVSSGTGYVHINIQQRHVEKACKRWVNRRHPRDTPVFRSPETAKKLDPEKTGGKVPA